MDFNLFSFTQNDPVQLAPEYIRREGKAPKTTQYNFKDLNELFLTEEYCAALCWAQNH
jgi:hypothetical protein